MNIVDKYLELNTFPVVFQYANELHPRPTQQDYSRGYIMRYFVKKVNDSPIIEVSYQNYETLSKFLYVMTSLKWEISGTKNDIFINGTIQSNGVYNNNLNSIKNAEKILPGISKKLKNPLQFYK